jgi:hypothetical protein
MAEQQDSQKEPLERPRHRCEDNIKVGLRAIGWGGMDWIDLAQGMDQWRDFVKTVMNLQVVSYVEKFLNR